MRRLASWVNLHLDGPVLGRSMPIAVISRACRGLRGTCFKMFRNALKKANNKLPKGVTYTSANVYQN